MQQVIKSASFAIAEALEHGWRAKARPDQIALPGEWFCFLLMGGRGAGKTKAGAEWVLEQVAAGRRRIALVGPTASDVRNVMTEGVSGILPCAPAYDSPTFN